MKQTLRRQHANVLLHFLVRYMYCLCSFGYLAKEIQISTIGPKEKKPLRCVNEAAVGLCQVTYMNINCPFVRHGSEKKIVHVVFYIFAPEMILLFLIQKFHFLLCS